LLLELSQLLGHVLAHGLEAGERLARRVRYTDVQDRMTR